MNAFETAKAVVPEAKGAHRIMAKSACTADTVTISIPISEIAKSHRTAKKDKAGKPVVDANGNVELNKSVGFMLEDVPFTVSGETFLLKTGWVTLAAGSK